MTPAELAEPTPADIANRLATDARSLAQRMDDYHGPVDDPLEHELDMLAESIRDLRKD